MTVYLFDMDGTLTPPRLPMTEDFADTFVHGLRTIKHSSRLDQTLPRLWNNFLTLSGIYCAMGNQLRQGHEIVYQKDFKLSEFA